MNIIEIWLALPSSSRDTHHINEIERMIFGATNDPLLRKRYWYRVYNAVSRKISMKGSRRFLNESELVQIQTQCQTEILSVMKNEPNNDSRQSGVPSTEASSEISSHKPRPATPEKIKSLLIIANRFRSLLLFGNNPPVDSYALMKGLPLVTRDNVFHTVKEYDDKGRCRFKSIEEIDREIERLHNKLERIVSEFDQSLPNPVNLDVEIPKGENSEQISWEPSQGRSSRPIEVLPSDSSEKMNRKKRRFDIKCPKCLGYDCSHNKSRERFDKQGTYLGRAHYYRCNLCSKVFPEGPRRPEIPTDLAIRVLNYGSLRKMRKEVEATLRFEDSPEDYHSTTCKHTWMER